LVAAALLVLAGLASACSTDDRDGDGDGGFQGFGDGRVNPDGTDCPQSRHCYALAGINPVCGNSSTSPPCLTGFQTHISFPGTAQRGDGYFTQEFWLAAFSCNCWIETGWLVSALNPAPVLFWAQKTPDNSEIATLGTAHYLGTLGPEDGNSGRFFVVREADGRFNIRVDTARVAYRTTISNAMWDDRGYGYVDMGMELVAISGAASTITFFTGNRAWSAPRTSDWVGNWAGATDSDDPPYGQWLLQPGPPPTPDGTDSEGGAYFTYCCLPLYGSEATATQTRARAGEDPTPEPPPPLEEALLARDGEPLAGVAAVDPTRDGEVPAFDPDQVGQWMASTQLGVPYDGDLTADPKVTCSLTAAEADQMLPAPTGLARDRGVCVAEAPGTFTITGPPSTEQAEPEVADTAYVVVDAATGNVLLAGAYRRT